MGKGLQVSERGVVSAGVNEIKGSERLKRRVGGK